DTIHRITTREGIPRQPVADRREVFPLKSGFLSPGNFAGESGGGKISICAAVVIEHGHLNRRRFAHPPTALADRARKSQASVGVEPGLGAAETRRGPRLAPAAGTFFLTLAAHAGLSLGRRFGGKVPGVRVRRYVFLERRGPGLCGLLAVV